MLDDKSVLAFIGARSGSKGLPDKNIKIFHGKPMLAWTIEAALNSTLVDTVVVSTDSKQYADIAIHYGANVIMRPDELAGGSASLMDAISYTVDELENQNNTFDCIVNLQPTSPLRTHIHIDEALALYQQHQHNKLTRVFSCYQIMQKYAWIMRCNASGHANFIDQQEQSKTSHARQNNADILLPNGAIFVLPRYDLGQFYNDYSVPYIMDESVSVDIDTLEDFNKAESLFTR